jgi:hypothetical protein
MTLNEALNCHHFVTLIKFTDGDTSLSKELKAKLMAMRIQLSKFRKSFDEDVKEAAEQIKTEEFNNLGMKEDKTPEEQARFDELLKTLDAEYNEFIRQKGTEEVSYDKWLTEEEFYQIVEVNSSEDVEVNGIEVSAPDFLEVVYNLFVK